MAAKKASTPPVRVPVKLGTMGPESGPSGEAVVDADAPGAGSVIEATSPESRKAAKAQEAAQKAAENTKGAREVKVMATERGYIGTKVREAGDVFVLQLDAGQPLPSWVQAVADANVATTPLSHSSEAQEEVVDSKGIGHTPENLAKTLVQ